MTTIEIKQTPRGIMIFEPGYGRYGRYGIVDPVTARAQDDGAASILVGGSDDREADPGLRDRLDAAIRQTGIDGQPRTVAGGKPTTPVASIPESSHLCPRCGTYCHDDCTSSR
jgi:hypothetical protein